MILRRTRMRMKRDCKISAIFISIFLFFLFLVCNLDAPAHPKYTDELPAVHVDESSNKIAGNDESSHEKIPPPVLEAPEEIEEPYTGVKIQNHKLTEAEILSVMDPALKPLFGSRKKSFSNPINEILYNFPTIGEASLSQYRQLRTLESDLMVRKAQSEVLPFEFDRFVHVHYQNRYTFDCRDKEKVYFIGTINESKHTQKDHSDKPVTTKGGASFIVSIEGENFGVSYCTVFDHLNGQYSWLCPFAKYACVRIRIVLTYLNFEAFRHYSHIVGYTRFDQEFCYDEATKHTHCAIPHSPMLGRWKGATFNSPESGISYNAADRNAYQSMCACSRAKVKKLLIFVNNPEQGLKYQCMSDYCLEKRLAIQVHIIKNVDTYRDEEIDTKIKSGEKHVFIDAGMWMINKGPQYAMEQFEKDNENAIRKIINKFGAENVTLISTTSTPQAIKEDMQNNAILAALAQVQREFAQKLSIGFVDIFEPTFLKFKTGRLIDSLPNYFTNSNGECEFIAAAKAAYVKMLDHLCKLN